jgi:MFS family permease
MWPVGVALASEAWPNAWRPLLAGLIGTSANIGLVVLGLIGSKYGIEPDHWRWVMLVGASPVVLGVFVLVLVPESPTWLAHRDHARATNTQVPISAVFRPPYLKVTILGIVLGTIPLLGGWGSVNWLIPWADKVGDPTLSSTTQTMRSAGAALGSLLGGWLASQFGRRSTYFTVSLLSLLSSGYIFWFLTPQSSGFLAWTFVLGFACTVYFGWLPLYLPELFPTKVRATGSGVTFNFGRILSAVGVLGSGSLLVYFNDNDAYAGRVTHLIFAVGMLVILFAPDTSQRRMDE